MPFPRWMPAYVALGSNLDDPRSQVERAVAALAGLPDTRLVLCSSLYRSRPFGPVDQPDFVNAVAGVLTQLDPAALLAQLKALEARLGRERPVVRWGPRNALMAAFLSHLVMCGLLLIFGLLCRFRFVFLIGWFLIVLCLLLEHWIARRRSLDWINTAFFRLNAVIS